MNKKTIKLFTILTLSTALASAVFITVQVLLDIILGSEHTVSAIFLEIRTFVDLLAEYTAYTIVLYCFCRYKLETALKSFIFAGSSFLFAIFCQLGGTVAFNIASNPSISGSEVIVNSIGSFSSFLSSSIITRVLPCILLAILAYKITKNKATKPQKFISFKNEITRVIAIFTLVIFVINLASLIIADASYLSTITRTEFFKQFGSWGNYILIILPEYLFVTFYYLIYIYCILFFGYKLCDKLTENDSKN